MENRSTISLSSTSRQRKRVPANKNSKSGTLCSYRIWMRMKCTLGDWGMHLFVPSLSPGVASFFLAFFLVCFHLFSRERYFSRKGSSHPLSVSLLWLVIWWMQAVVSLGTHMLPPHTAFPHLQNLSHEASKLIFLSFKSFWGFFYD